MKDIDIAIKALKEDELTLAIVNDGKLIYNSKQRGVLPIYLAATSAKYNTEGTSVADKVTGKGAALLCAYGKINYLHTGILSKSAAEVLNLFDISFTYDKLVDFITNRSGDGSCPVEALTKNINNPKEAIKPIEGFLKGIGVV